MRTNHITRSLVRMVTAAGLAAVILGSALTPAQATSRWAVAASPAPGQPYQLVLEWGLRCLETPLESDGVDFLFQWPCHGGSHQGWTFEPVEPAAAGYFQIVSQYDEGCVTGLGAGGADVRNQPCRRTAGERKSRQEWRLSPVRDGYYEIVNRYTGLCIDILHGGDGSHAVQYGCHRGGNQLWALR
ncbi:RICIN domain-containing protein [Jidongwangia harbinensis]|uniref:RICIN domain-containing protein n=1 Tax=Jidongwangia harbinensis TaxID=2878561 RepID=UPI001CD9AFE8|nr:RICIN domain-containing protein [Jidongwangia harbinensis]MCA2211400.1 ricin-type beta-trefoil lectin domain protein [Jidongwangia harbinensis]